MGSWIFEPDGVDTRLLCLQSLVSCSVSGSHNNPLAGTLGDDRKSYSSSIGLLGACWSGGHWGRGGAGRAGGKEEPTTSDSAHLVLWTDSRIIPR